MNVIVPPSNCALHDNIRPGSRTIVMKPKSARQARGGVPLDTRIFACQTSETGIDCKTKGHQLL